MKQLDTTSEKVRISNLLANREIYLNFPDCQRNGGIWPRIMEQYLIDTILRGDYIPPIASYRDEDSNLSVLDGRQRLTTIQKFANDGFTTGRSKRLGEQFIAPGCRFSGLSDEYKKRFLSYLITFDILQTDNIHRIMEIYKKCNRLVQLKGAELAYANDSLAREAAIEIQEHNYFSVIYAGDKERMQPFQMSLYLLEMEVFRICCDLRDGKYKGVAAGGRDELITSEVVMSIIDKLTMAVHLFEGLAIVSPNVIIPHYQAVNFLLFAGYDINASERSCLADWYRSIVTDWHFYSRFSGVAFQSAFWHPRLHDMANCVGLVGGPNSRQDITRLSSWLRNSHICSVCQETVKMEDIRDHCFGSSDHCKIFASRHVSPVSIMRVS